VNEGKYLGVNLIDKISCYKPLLMASMFSTLNNI